MPRRCLLLPLKRYRNMYARTRQHPTLTPHPLPSSPSLQNRSEWNPLASLDPLPSSVRLGVGCNGHYKAEKQPPLYSIVCSNSDLPKLYIKHPWEPLSPLVRSPLLLEFY